MRARGGQTIYEMRSAIHAEMGTREVRQRATPSLQRERLHERQLRLMSMPPAIAMAAVAPTPGRGLLARVGALLARRTADAPRRAGSATAA